LSVRGDMTFGNCRKSTAKFMLPFFLYQKIDNTSLFSSPLADNQNTTDGSKFSNALTINVIFR
jgi:hypothetical protein